MRERDSSLRVLVAARDRRFRTVTSALLSRRGCAVAVADLTDGVPERAARERAQVVVLDASSSLTTAARTAAELRALQPPIEVVAVSGDRTAQLATLPVLPKWGSFDTLFGAVERARGRWVDA